MILSSAAFVLVFRAVCPGHLSGQLLMRMKLNSSLIGLLLSVTLIGSVAIGPDLAAADDRFAAQRAQFFVAEKALDNGQYKRFWRITNQLKDYPLYPYLLFAELRKRLPSAATAEIELFLSRYADTPLARRLRIPWLFQLAKRKRWRQFLLHYRDTTNSRLQCLRLQALLNTRAEAAFRIAVKAQWHSGRSQPEECDPGFAAWHARGGLTSNQTWQRHQLVMEIGNRRLARYLLRFMNATDRKLAEQWQHLQRNAKQVVNFRLGPDHRSQRLAIATQVLHRMARRNPEAAAALWDSHLVRHLPPATRQAFSERLALSFAYRHQPEALLWAQKASSDGVGEKFSNWRITAALRHGHWKHALAWINALSSERKNTERWRYWRAQALGQLGQDREAKALYAELAVNRSYYGFLAADQIQAPYRFNYTPVQAPGHGLQALSRQEAMMRTRELLWLDYRLDARREWRDFIRGADQATLQAAALLAQQWKWHAAAITAIARARLFDDIELRFPLAYVDEVDKQSKRYGVSPGIILAIIREESAFRADARSPAGAIGLMQIIPRTGRYIAKKLGLRWKGNRSLYQPQINLRYGTFYVQHLRSRSNGNLVLSSVAYNAGMRQVKRWLPKTGSVAATIWIENIPFTETRNYVRRILEFIVVYEHRLGAPQTRLSDRLQPITATALE